VNEFWREARLKLFSYAVAALSNFFGPPSKSHWALDINISVELSSSGLC